MVDHEKVCEISCMNCKTQVTVQVFTWHYCFKSQTIYQGVWAHWCKSSDDCSSCHPHLDHVLLPCLHKYCCSYQYLHSFASLGTQIYGSSLAVNPRKLCYYYLKLSKHFFFLCSFLLPGLLSVVMLWAASVLYLFVSLFQLLLFSPAMASSWLNRIVW